MAAMIAAMSVAVFTCRIPVLRRGRSSVRSLGLLQAVFNGSAGCDSPEILLGLDGFEIFKNIVA